MTDCRAWKESMAHSRSDARETAYQYCEADVELLGIDLYRPKNGDSPDWVED